MKWLMAMFGMGALLLPRTVDNRPRGIRNNNPGNIRHGQNWQGMAAVQNDPAFITFESPEWGLRAMARILTNYERLHGIDTVAGIISRWAPPVENDTGAYIAFVAKRLGVAPEERIDVPARMAELIGAIVLYENGRQPYSLAMINEGVSRA